MTKAKVSKVLETESGGKQFQVTTYFFSIFNKIYFTLINVKSGLFQNEEI